MPKTKLQAIRQNDKVILARQCPFCGKETRKEMDAKEFYDGIEAYQNGALVQNAFPKADTSLRELIITGICDACWENL